MNLLTLVNALLTLNIRVSVQKADALYKALGLDGIAADLEYYRGECQRLNELNHTLRSAQSEDQNLALLRAKLTGTTNAHQLLVNVALDSASIIDSLANGKKIQAIRDLRAAAQCGLKEAKDAVEDRRVTERANLPEWERNLLYYDTDHCDH